MLADTVFCKRPAFYPAIFLFPAPACVYTWNHWSSNRKCMYKGEYICFAMKINAVFMQTGKQFFFWMENKIQK